MRRLLLSMLFMCGAAYSAIVPGTMVEYYPSKDPITDENTGRVFVREVNDTGGNNVVMFACADGFVDVYLLNKSPLLTETDYDNGRFPTIIYRVDAQQPKTLTGSGATNNGERSYDALAFLAGESATLYTAFRNAQSKVVVRVLRTGMKELTFTFPTRGFIQGMRSVSDCR